MARVLEIRHLAAYIREIQGVLNLAAAEATIATATNAEAGAKKIAARIFTGSDDRPKRGWLLNAIFAGYELEQKGRTIAEAFVAVRSQKGNAGTKPYGRIQEFGGTVKPVKAKWLWIPLFGPGSSGVKSMFRNMSPSDFVAAMIQQRQNKSFPGVKGGARSRRAGQVAGIAGRFGMMFSGSGGVAYFTPASTKGVKSQMITLFALRKSVTLPAKPYVRPAVEKEWKKLPDRMATALRRLKKG